MVLVHSCHVTDLYMYGFVNKEAPKSWIFNFLLLWFTKEQSRGRPHTQRTFIVLLRIRKIVPICAFINIWLKIYLVITLYLVGFNTQTFNKIVNNPNTNLHFEWIAKLIFQYEITTHVATHRLESQVTNLQSKIGLFAVNIFMFFHNVSV